MNTHFSQKRIDYTGEQLRSHWARRTFGVKGDCIVSFLGSCDVKPEFMVDLEDLESGSRIYSPLMLHFIIEHFGSDLRSGVLMQRLLAAIACEHLRNASGLPILRSGDDLYLEKKKISVSIATCSAVSTLIHFGINVQTKGVPVLACGLEELGLKADVTAHHIMAGFAGEIASVEISRTCARPVR